MVLLMKKMMTIITLKLSQLTTPSPSTPRMGLLTRHLPALNLPDPEDHRVAEEGHGVLGLVEVPLPPTQRADRVEHEGARLPTCGLSSVSQHCMLKRASSGGTHAHPHA
jgi:hypothetical protein